MISRNHKGFLIEMDRVGTFGSHYTYRCGTYRAMRLKDVEAYIDSLLKSKESIKLELSKLTKVTGDEVF